MPDPKSVPYHHEGEKGRKDEELGIEAILEGYRCRNRDGESGVARRHAAGLPGEGEQGFSQGMTGQAKKVHDRLYELSEQKAEDGGEKHRVGEEG